MNPVKLLASRNILIGVAVLGVLMVAFVMLQTRTVSSETIPSADRIGPPPVASGEAVSIDQVLTEYKRNRSSALRHYRKSPINAQVTGVTPVAKSGWAAAVTVNDGRATLYFAESTWPSIAPQVGAGQSHTFTCADWQSGPAGVLMYGCGLVDAH